MTFLSGETIRNRFKIELIIKDRNDKNIFDENKIDCNSYHLAVGSDIIITDDETISPKNIKLDINEAFTIPPGQFSLIVTEEIINIPKDLMGFISIRFKKKLMGLINVSGFHVDPGWTGRLIFAVYNAGPNNITIQRGDTIFQIWFSKIDIENSEFIKRENPQTVISSEVLNFFNGSIYSPQSLIKKIHDIELSNRKYWFGIIISLVIGLAIGVVIDFSKAYFDFNGGFKQEIFKYIENTVKEQIKAT